MLIENCGYGIEILNDGEIVRKAYRGLEPELANLEKALEKLTETQSVYMVTTVYNEGRPYEPSVSLPHKVVKNKEVLEVKIMLDDKMRNQ